MIFEAAVALILLLGISWVAFFGTIGLLLGLGRGLTGLEGFLCGALLGPFGFIPILWRSREAGAATVQASAERQPSSEPPSGAEFDWREW